MNTPNKILVAQARAEWIATMTIAYPDFQAHLWEKNSRYRFTHPQLTLTK